MPMTRIAQALAAIQWGPQTLARAVNVDERTVRRWQAGQNEPPRAVLAWLEALAEVHRRLPPPQRPDAA